MPVWHAATRDAVQRGELIVVGVLQEQHPDRARLFAQWHELDWPLLWDPFNSTGDVAVPLYRFVDEHGIVRDARAKPAALAAFLATDFEAPAEPIAPAPTDARLRRRLVAEDGGDPDPRHRTLISALLWPDDGDERARFVDLYASNAGQADLDPETRFRVGVALRLRHDSPDRRPDDFARALDAWRRALAQRPDQYIWRRRIQQYGPRLDKPYPFYDWVDEARAAILQRGEEPIPLAAALTGAESAGKGAFPEPAEGAADETEPDPDGAAPRDTAGGFRLSAAVAFDTEGRPVARLLGVAEPAPNAGWHWNNEVEPARVWLDADALPEGWRVAARLHVLPSPDPPAATSHEPRAFDVEVAFPEGFTGRALLPGYLLTHACSDADGTCVLVRRDFTFTIERAAPDGPR